MEDFKDFIREIHNKLDIVNFVSKYVKLKKQGSNFVGLCPFHHEKTPSFVVSPAKQIFHCFGCGASGDVVKFAMMIENLDFKETLIVLAQEANLPKPVFKGSGKSSKERDEIRFTNEFLLSFYKDSLNNSAVAYLKNRGLKEEMIDKFGLGFAPQDSQTLIRLAKENNISESQLISAGCFKRIENGRLTPYFWNRIMIPIFDVNGGVVGFSGRSLDGKEPKYLNSPDTSLFKKGTQLYLISFTKEFIKESGRAIIVEGYFDAIALYQEGVKNVVSSMGTSFTEDQAKLLKRFAENLYFFFDNDQGGRLGAERAVEACGKFDIPISIVVSDYMADPDEIVLKYGSEKIIFLMDNAKDPIKFIADFELSKSDNTPQSKAKVVDKLLYTVSKISNKTTVYEYIKQIAILLEIDPRALIDQYNKNLTNMRKQKTEPLSIETNKIRAIEEVLTQAVLQRKETAELILNSIDVETAFEEPYRTVFRKALDDIKSGHEPDPASWFDLKEEESKLAITLSLRDLYLVRDEALYKFLKDYETYKTYNSYITNLFSEIKNSKEKAYEYDEANRKLKGYK